MKKIEEEEDIIPPCVTEVEEEIDVLKLHTHKLLLLVLYSFGIFFSFLFLQIKIKYQNNIIYHQLYLSQNLIKIMTDYLKP